MTALYQHHRWLVLIIGIIAIQGCATTIDSPADLTITNALVVSAPGQTADKLVNISIRDSVIVSIYGGKPKRSREVIDANGRTVTAGLWNSHVHFTDLRLMQSSQSMLHDMLFKYGFTTVVDTGSSLPFTLSLKKRIEAGQLIGPTILTASGSFVFTDGTPSYLPDITLPEVPTAQAAKPMVNSVLDSGANGIKIFSGSFQAQREPIYLPPEIIDAIADAAHARDAFVMSHPTDRTGLVNAVENGVDILAHTAPQAGPLGAELVATMKRNDVALIPTLKLWKFELVRAGVEQREAEALQNLAVNQLSEYVAAQGLVIFGTDVGYMTDFDTLDEFRLMAKSGMSFDQTLASMTTNPSTFFGGKTAQLAPGAAADIVIYETSPIHDIEAFARVDYTIKGGQVVYRKNP